MKRREKICVWRYTLSYTTTIAVYVLEKKKVRRVNGEKEKEKD